MGIKINNIFVMMYTECISNNMNIYLRLSNREGSYSKSMFEENIPILQKKYELAI